MMRWNRGQGASWRLARGEQSLREGFSLKEGKVPGGPKERLLEDPRVPHRGPKGTWTQDQRRS